MEKTLVLSVICSKCKNKHEKIFKDKESFDILITLNISQESRLKNINGARNYFLEEI